MKEKIELQIDRDSLDVEWVNQPSLYFKHASRLADARRDSDEAKSDLEVMKAELDKQIRSDPTAFGMSKATEVSIAATVSSSAAYQLAQQAVFDAKHKVDIFQALVTALDHRKKALENLVSLWSQSYFAAPKAPEGSEERMEDVKKRSIRRKGRGGRTEV